MFKIAAVIIAGFGLLAILSRRRKWSEPFWQFGVPTIIDYVRPRNPQTPTAKAQDFIDNRFIRELDESGFIENLY